VGTVYFFQYLDSGFCAASSKIVIYTCISVRKTFGDFFLNLKLHQQPRGRKEKVVF